ncbi:hypothetical protein TNCV_3815861 [Trichonephila clavipes]|nr:hypothetical protein TNCV_3815861 [Trichonephila clavipes]
MVSSKIGDGEGHDQTRFASSGVKWGYEIMLANENSNWTCPWTHGGWGESYTRAFGDGPRNLEPWSSDVDDT